MGVPYAEVIGDPVAHSKSPLIHKFWLAKLGIPGDYRATRVTAEELPVYLEARRADPDWRGCNVTMPLKREILNYADEQDAGAAHAGNCLVHTGRDLHVFNTDHHGVDEALRETFHPVCVLGSGGAAHAAVSSLEVLASYDFRIVARNAAEAYTILAENGFDASVYDFPHAADAMAGAEAVVNATPLGMSGFQAMPRSVLDGLAATQPNALVFDMVYDPIETALLSRAKELRRRTVDGLVMLTGQATASFRLLFGAEAPRAHDAELRQLLLA